MLMMRRHHDPFKHVMRVIYEDLMQNQEKPPDHEIKDDDDQGT